jgi:hypothetical protein
MNISETEAPIRVIAKTCGCRDNNKRKVTSALVDSYHSLCLDKNTLYMQSSKPVKNFLNIR